MRYKIRGYSICSENAARSFTQAARPVLEWIEGQKLADHGLDYGCGKLRYAPAMAVRCRKLTLVDSRIQLTRQQMVLGSRTCVREVAIAKWQHVRILAAEDFVGDGERYDLALCANVLSAIPCPRARAGMLRSIAQSLLPQGLCLFVTQYRNSYFSRIAASPDVVEHLDGWILDRGGTSFYYGILPKDKVVQLVRRYGFRVREAWTTGESAFVVAGPQE